ncbi:MAG: EamA family transporter [Patescibacteria group bacterium]|nr:EamA family transporter [Patescibacteria group bacterium]
MVYQLILLYASFAAVDVMDKFLISKRQVRPLQYAFYTVVTGGAILLVWPWVFQHLPPRFIALDLLSGAYYGLVMYVYFKILSHGEVSRVVPFVFGLVPIFDIFISLLTNRSVLTVQELAAMSLLIPGALLIAYKPGKYLHKYLGLTLLSAFLYSSYNFLWQYGAQHGPVLNNLMWNRLGAAGAMALLLLIPAARKNIAKTDHVKHKAHTGFLFLFKQGLGGLNFILLSYFLAVSKVPIVDGLSAFRYLFLFVAALYLGFNHRHILDEAGSKHEIRLKLAALVLIFGGTTVLFLPL